MTRTVKGATGQSRRAGAPAAGESPSQLLQQSLQKLAGTMTERAVGSLSDRLTGATDRLTDYAQNGGGSGLLAAATGIDKLASGSSPLKAALSSGVAGATGKVKESLKGVTGSLLGRKGKGSGKKLKLTNIVEDIDVGVPLDLAYRQWTEFGSFPKFMKKVEQVEQESDEKERWKAQVFWSHRTWESTIIDQVPCERIVWRSKGAKGYVDGAVTFHELAPELTRILVVLEYHPKGLFERTGNLWRAQGRRVRLELKHFRRHVMTYTVLHPDEVEGWLGEIHDGKVTSNGEEARADEQKSAQPPRQRRTSEGDGVSRQRNGGNGEGASRRRAPSKERSEA